MCLYQVALCGSQVGFVVDRMQINLLSAVYARRALVTRSIRLKFMRE